MGLESGSRPIVICLAEEGRVITSYQSVYAHLLAQIARNRELPALLTPGKSEMTFGALGDQVQAARQRLAGVGLGKGSRIGLMVGARDAFATAYFGVISCATAVPLNPAMTQSELEFDVLDFELDALIVDAPSESVVKVARRNGLPLLHIQPDVNHCGAIHFMDGWKGPGADPQMPRPADYSVLSHTSGTTGRPKTVPRTNANGLAAVENEWLTTGMSQDDRTLNVLPLFNSQGLLGDLQPVLLKDASVILAEFDARNFLGLIEQYRPSFFTLVPTMFQAVLENAGDKPAATFDSLRFVRSSSAALTVNLKKSIEDTFQVPVIQAYGSTEAGGIAMTGLTPESNRDGSVGRPLHSGVAIMDDTGEALGTGDRGEVWVTGPLVMPGYVDNEPANAEVFRGNWYRSGDQGYIDDDGFLFLTGRLRETINRGGELISPQQVDEVLEMHECVAQAASFGVPNEKLGEELLAALVLKAGCDPNVASIRSFAAERLSFSRVPKQIFVVNELPVNQSGKVMRSTLAQRFVAGEM